MKKCVMVEAIAHFFVCNKFNYRALFLFSYSFQKSHLAKKGWDIIIFDAIDAFFSLTIPPNDLWCLFALMASLSQGTCLN